MLTEQQSTAAGANGAITAEAASSVVGPSKPRLLQVLGPGLITGAVMVILMLMTSERRILGEFTIGGWLSALDWLSTAAMAACVGWMAATWLV